MAAFTTMAIIGAAAAGGMFAGSKIASSKIKKALGDASRTNPNQGPAPVAAPAPRPPDTGRAASEAIGSANLAAQATRRRAQGSGVQLPEKGRRRNPVAELQPRTLLGS